MTKIQYPKSQLRGILTRLSVAIVVLSILASIGGLFLQDRLYRDNDFVTVAWFGNDMITLFVATPVLVTAIILARKHDNLRAYLVWLGMLDYTLYNFAFYLFGCSFNAFFLVYEALFVVSILALVVGVMEIDMKKVDKLQSGRKRREQNRWIAGYMIFVGLSLTIVYTAQTIAFIRTGDLPEVIILTGKDTSIVFALDLSLVVPLFILGGLWLWQSQPLGYVIAVVMNVKGTVYMMALFAATVANIHAGIIEDWSQATLWGSICFASFVSVWLLLRWRGQDSC